MRGRSLLVFAVLGLSGRATSAQTAVPSLGADREATAELTKIVEATREKGLPVDPIIAKARYALVVRAAPDRIVAIARDMASRLEVAREALAPNPIPNDITAGEAALHYVPRGVLTEVRRVSPPDSSVAVPLGVLTQLVSSGVSVKNAADIVTSLIKRGASAQQLASLSNDVNSDVQRGSRPDDALGVRMRGLTAALAPFGAVTAATADMAAPQNPGPLKPKRP